MKPFLNSRIKTEVSLNGKLYILIRAYSILLYTFWSRALHTSCSFSEVMSRGTSKGEPRTSPSSSWNWINSLSTSSLMILGLRSKSTIKGDVY